MIISRTPFRISFFGGGTDYPIWYRDNGGVVLNTTIDKYCYISCRFLPPFFDYKYRIRYSLREEKGDIDEIQHPAVRECLKFMRIKQGIEMVHTSDLPARSGIGSSSAFTIGFLNALYALAGRMVGKRRLASNAIYVEQDVVGESVGSQDQVAASFGGFNRIEFNGKENFIVQPVTLNRKRITELQNHLMFFFTGFSRTASEIVVEQIRNTASKATELKNMSEMVDEAVEILNNGNTDIEGFGKLLDESWRLKRSLSSRVSTDAVDKMYEVALNAGAIGGKLCGAGGGGFMLLFVPPRKQRQVRKALDKFLHVPFNFETLGSQIIVYAHQDSY
jgi:D-glycero-alpha-D-manno-heptose-7-phosphate kinase